MLSSKLNTLKLLSESYHSFVLFTIKDVHIPWVINISSTYALPENLAYLGMLVMMFISNFIWSPGSAGLMNLTLSIVVT